MDCYDGPEVCKIVGTIILSKLANIIFKINTGLYCDDGVVVLRSMNAERIDKIGKIIITMSQEVLDVRFNLISGLYTPYKKPNGNLLYINALSDHIPQIVKQLTNSINKKLCGNSDNEQVFNTVKLVYKNALLKSGYKSSIKFSEANHHYNSKKTQKMIWFNPPFSQTVKTNVPKLFFRLLDKHFPKSHLLYKTFIRNTIIVSYSYMNNVLQIIKQYNRKVYNKKNKPN